MKCLKKILIPILLMTSLISCQQKEEFKEEKTVHFELPNGYTEEEILNIKTELMDFYFDYDNSELFSYEDDALISNYWKKPDRCHSYDIYYGEDEGKYYCLYLKQEGILSQVKSYLNENDPMAFSTKKFTAYSKEYVVDGKYLRGYRALFETMNADDFGIMVEDSLDDISYVIDGYQLIFCAKRKSVTYFEDLTANVVFNKTCFAYLRYPVEYNEEEKKIKKSNAVKNTDFQERAEKEFATSGEVMQIKGAYSYAPDVMYYPYQQNKYRDRNVPIVIEGEEKYVALPRYRVEQRGKKIVKFRDYLLDNTFQTFGYDDADHIYDGYRTYFQSMFYKDDAYETADYSYSSFKIDAIRQIGSGKVPREE